MEQDENNRRESFFRYKVLEDQDILQHSQPKSRRACSNCLLCTSQLPRCLKASGLCVVFTASLFLAMAPWAMAITETVMMPVLYVIVVRDWKLPHLKHMHYSWWKSEEDVVLFSWLRALTAFVAFLLGFGNKLHIPYLVVSIAFAAVSVLYLAVKAVMLRHPLISKWGVLLLVCSLFSAAHVFVALNVNLFARRRQQMGLLGQDEERLGLMQRNDGDNFSADDTELPAEELADGKSRFIDCNGLKVHYNVEQPQDEADETAAIVLIHGFGGGAFAWRLIMAELAAKSRCRVYALDRPGFGLTTRPMPTSLASNSPKDNPYSLAFQATLVISLCRLWGCRRVVLVGHSDGALVALKASAEACRQMRPAFQPANGRTSLSRASAERCAVDTSGSSPSQSRPSLQTDKISQGLDSKKSLQDPPAAGSTGSPSSPFSKWLQLGQPTEPHLLQIEAKTQGGEPVGLATNELMGEERDTQQPSLALGSASAVLGPERNKFTGISTGAAGGRESERAAVVGPNRNSIDVEVTPTEGKCLPISLILLHPSFDGRAKPQIARVLSRSRVGRRILRRLLRSEIGEVANKRAWYDSSRLTSETLRLYKAPLRVRGWEAGLIEASRVRREATASQLASYFADTARIPKLLVTGLYDRIAPPTMISAIADQLGGQCQCEILPHCGHLSHEEASSALLGYLIDFVRGVL